MKRSGYLQRQEIRRQIDYQNAERITRQLMYDCMQIVLHDEFGFGYDRIKRMTKSLEKAYDTWIEACSGGNEADYMQEKLDQALRDIVKDNQEFLPFRERYPELREARTVK